MTPREIQYPEMYRRYLATTTHHGKHVQHEGASMSATCGWAEWEGCGGQRERLATCRCTVGRSGRGHVKGWTPPRFARTSSPMQKQYGPSARMSVLPSDVKICHSEMACRAAAGGKEGGAVCVIAGCCALAA